VLHGPPIRLSLGLFAICPNTAEKHFFPAVSHALSNTSSAKVQTRRPFLISNSFSNRGLNCHVYIPQYYNPNSLFVRTRVVRKVSVHFEYLENRSRDLDVTWQPVRGDLTMHPWTVTLPWGYSVGSETLLTEIVYCVTVALKMTERAEQLHHDNAPAHSTPLLQVYFGKPSRQPDLSAPLQPGFGSVRLLACPKAKIAVEREEICECDGHTVHKVSQRRLTAGWLAPRESDCSWTHSKDSSNWLPSYIKATRPVLEIIRTAGYFPNIPRDFVWSQKLFWILSMYTYGTVAYT
jgi:hypothetical protein